MLQTRLRQEDMQSITIRFTNGPTSSRINQCHSYHTLRYIIEFSYSDGVVQRYAIAALRMVLFCGLCFTSK